jgi:superfamily II DNA or RNA helicase
MGDAQDKNRLRQKIAREQARLAELERERNLTQTRLDELRAELETAPRAAAPVSSALVGIPTKPMGMEKVHLFRDLFRGRVDVFATRFVSKKTGRPGYAPACTNKWVRGICELPRIKCGECANQAFIPVTDEILIDHLMGKQVVGIYPLLEDESCWFLAIDFDKASWQADVAAVVETCHGLGLEPSVERSRSGNGAHLWFFFAAPVPARTARAMGCSLITTTMSRHHELSMESYDRLFPNQDTLPRGGFGNLIALPLQREPREHRNTVFVDDRFEPHPDQWKYLASVHRLPPEKVESMAQDAMRRGQVLGVRVVEPTDEDDATPWTVPPSGRRRELRILGPLPGTMQAVLAQRLFVEKNGLSAALINEIKRLAAFQNPEFYKKQRLRLWTGSTPRIISCAEDRERHVALPRGCLPDLEELLHQFGIHLSLDDRREGGHPLPLQFRGRLSGLQEQMATKLLGHDIGVLVAPPGVGKTVLGTYLVAHRGRSTLILVHRQPLLDQWVAQLAMFLGIDEREIGQIGGGKRKPTGRLDVAMLQSLVRCSNVDDIVASYGHVIVDECHHLPALSFERVLSEVRARYIVGLTATPHRRDGHQPITEMQLGPVRFAVDPKDQAASRVLHHRLVVRETEFNLLDQAQGLDTGIQELYRALVADEARNRLILDDVLAALSQGRSPILLTERRDHLDWLAVRLQRAVRHLIILTGGKTTRHRQDSTAKLAQIPDEEERLILATGRYIGEGFDDARLDTLFLALPVSWRGTLVQYAGRLHRLHPLKTDVLIFDYVDRKVPMLLRMFEKRRRTYRAIGYLEQGPRYVDNGPLKEPVVEWDQEALRHFGDPS